MKCLFWTGIFEILAKTLNRTLYLCERIFHEGPVGHPPGALEDEVRVGVALGVGVLQQRVPLVELLGAADPVVLPEAVLWQARRRRGAGVVVLTRLRHRLSMPEKRG